MTKFLKSIGAVVFSLMIFAIPVVCTLSFVYSWNWYLKLILIIGTGIEVAVLTMSLVEIGD